MNLPSYPAYRCAGAEWLGAVPEHWRTVPLWTCFQRAKRTGVPHEELLSVYRDHGVLPKNSRMDNFNKPSDDLGEYQLVEPGDLVVNKMKAWQGSVAVSDVRGIVSPAYFVFARRHAQHSRYLHLLLRSTRYVLGYRTMSKGIRVNQWDVEPERLRVLPVLLPPSREQVAIVALLDRETHRIDVLIAEQRRLLELLKEKRQAVISHAVTCGIAPGVPFVPTGHEWLGRVPAHWRHLKVKHLMGTIEQGWSPQCEEFPVGDEDAWGVMKAGCVNGGVFRPEENKTLPVGLEPAPELGLSAGDLLMSRANTRELVGSAAVVDKDYPRLLLCDKLYRLRPRLEELDAHFLCFYLGSSQVRSQLELAATGASYSMVNISQSSVLELPIAVPPLDEQRSIVRTLEGTLAGISGLTNEVLASIALLEERRSALITAAVTGQIDVRGLVPQEASS